MTKDEFPILDFSKFHNDFDAFATEIFNASNRWGFFILTNHGVTKVDDMFQLSKEFFDLPLEQKTQKPIDEKLTGYDGHKLTTFAASEGISFGLPAGSLLGPCNLHSWWDSGKRQELEDFKSGCYDLSINIMSCFAVKLGLEKSYFSSYHQHQDPGNVLKFIKYPRFDEKPVGVPRLSEHTDWGSITFVFTDRPGLEVRDPSNQWYQIPTVPGGLVVNIGDALSLWSKKSLKSTMHRISWENLDTTEDRLSIVYFTHPNNDARLQCPLDESTDALTYREYLRVRSALTYGSIWQDKEGGEGPTQFDPRVFELVKSLNVANDGTLENHKRTTVV